MPERDGDAWRLLGVDGSETFRAYGDAADISIVGSGASDSAGSADPAPVSARDSGASADSAAAPVSAGGSGESADAAAAHLSAGGTRASDAADSADLSEATEWGAAPRLRLWHPIRATTARVRAWRAHLMDAELNQPFKQAFREIYRLTPAEEATRVYSNRYAAHILKYGQAKALLTTRGWTGPQLGYWDGGYETQATRVYRDLSTAPDTGQDTGSDTGQDTGHGAGRRIGQALRRGIGQRLGRGGQSPAQGTGQGAGRGVVREWAATFYLELVDREADGYLRVSYCSSDQVRFSRSGSTAPVRLSELPPLVFSEAMRDLDLVVGVSSIAADPQWHDAGEDRHLAYWRQTGFGELTESAEMRRTALERLIPRLKIAERLELTDRFLKVRGNLRTYKIHLGSANILMEPDDSYLCIVTARGADAGQVFLPFESDGGRLSLILSKAFLLADDTAITDPTITRQLKRGL
jgi:hypothetical protein